VDREVRWLSELIDRELADPAGVDREPARDSAVPGQDPPPGGNPGADRTA
jgi:hypothetical protein